MQVRCLRWQRVGCILTSRIERSTHTCAVTQTHTHTCSQNPGTCPALAGADAAMRTVISPTVAVATPTRGKSLAVFAHASVCVWACVCLWLWQKLELEEEKKKEEEKGGPVGIHIVPGLFKVYASFTYHLLPGEILNWPFQLSRQ